MYACTHGWMLACMLSPIEPVTLYTLRDCVSPLISIFYGISLVMPTPVIEEGHIHTTEMGKCYEARLSAQSLTATAYSCPSLPHSHSTTKVSMLGPQAPHKSSNSTSLWAVKLEERACPSPSSKLPNMVTPCPVSQIDKASEAPKHSLANAASQT